MSLGLEATLSEEPSPYATLSAAQEAGAVTWNYGMFSDNLIALLIVAVALFVVVRTVHPLESQMGEHCGS